jgi:hypothetical protein
MKLVKVTAKNGFEEVEGGLLDVGIGYRANEMHAIGTSPKIALELLCEALTGKFNEAQEEANRWEGDLRTAERLRVKQ